MLLHRPRRWWQFQWYIVVCHSDRTCAWSYNWCSTCHETWRLLSPSNMLVPRIPFWPLKLAKVWHGPFIEAIMTWGVVVKLEIRIKSFRKLYTRLPPTELSMWSVFPPYHVSTLKKHSTSSVVLALGCSGGKFASWLEHRFHSRLSISVVTAIKDSRVRPRIPLRLL